MNINLGNHKEDLSPELCYRAYTGISFSPERRRDTILAEYAQSIENLADLIVKHAKDDRQKAMAQEVFDHYREGYKKFYTNWLNAKSNCISSMITGGSNFPVRRAEKANEREHKHCLALCEYSDKLEKYIVKRFAAAIPKAEKQDNELDAMRKKLANAEKFQEDMKTVNRLIRKKDDNAALLAWCKDRYGEKEGESKMNILLTPNCFGGVGFERYQLTNNLANIKRMKDRVIEMEAKAQKREEAPVEEETYKALTVVRNHDDDRLQLLFDDKPEDDVRTLLKRNGFRWAPSKAAWQRQITDNANRALHRLFCEPTMQQYVN